MTTALIVIVLFVAAILIAALFAGKEMNIERSVIIEKPLSEVFNYLKFVRNQDNFSVWNMTDPNMNKNYKGTDGEVGYIYSWDSPTNKNVGAGEQEVLSIEEGKNIQYEVRFSRPMKNVAKSGFVIDKVSENQTRVLWGFYSPAKFPMNVMKGMMEKMLGKDIEKSLDNLKSVLEK
ncbi:MAG: SRPBCC family protein [Paludibacter sp.]|nr:SRPBCC family protein [Paludibacter sp.]